jgi:hypothetical protein
MARWSFLPLKPEVVVHILFLYLLVGGDIARYKKRKRPVNPGEGGSITFLYLGE